MRSTATGRHSETSCAACEQQTLVSFYDGGAVPAHSCVLLDDATDAGSYPMGRMELAYCETCGFVQNLAFDQDLIDYGQDCEESQAFSPAFNRFARDLAQELVDDHGLRDGTALEVGCGKGDFLALMAEIGNIRGVGIDPGYRPGRQTDGRLEFVVDTFDDRYTHLTGDMVLTRHTLEHVPNVAEFTRLLIESAEATPGAPLFIEVPDAVRVLRDGAFWDVYHEHCSYFSLGSLARMMRRLGLGPEKIELAFEGQYLLATGTPGADPMVHAVEEPVEEIIELCRAFAQRVGDVVSHWRKRIVEASETGLRPVLWGGGSKAIAFIAAVDVTEHIAGVVDINPHKQSKFLAGSGLEVIAPERLKEIDPGLVIIMNPIYVNEITSMLTDLGLSPEVDAVT